MLLPTPSSPAAAIASPAHSASACLPSREIAEAARRRRGSGSAYPWTSRKSLLKTAERVSDILLEMPTVANHRRRRAAATLSAFGLVFVIACSRSTAPEPASPAPVRPEDPTCDSLRGARFRSRVVVPAGLGPDGPEIGHQFVSFSSEGLRYEWTREDMTFTGDYSCDRGKIQAAGAPFTDGKPFFGVLDPKTDVLTWGELEFERVP